MQFISRFITCAMLVVCSGALSHASGSGEPSSSDSKTKESAKEGDKGEKKYIITDFEEALEIVNVQDRVDSEKQYMRLYNGPQSPIKAEYATDEKYEGRKSVKVTTKTTDWSGIEIPIPRGSAIWSQSRSLKMWMLGSGSGTEIKIVVEDVKKEQFTYSIFDSFEGWQQVSIPIGAFTSRTDWQSDDAITNGKIDYPVKYFHFFTTNKGELVVYFDLIYVTDEGKKKKKGEEDENAAYVKPVYTLKDLASDYSFSIGSAATVSELGVPRLKETLVRDFSSTTAGNEMKFYVIRRDQKKWNFGPADKIVKFAEENGLLLRGHTLVWHQDMPGWLEKKKWKDGEVLELLEEYITRTVTRYKGKVFCWDVVNEPFAGSGELRSGYDSVWHRECGEEYIEKAFIWAHEADPEAKLFLNDFGVETINIKSTAMYNFVKKMLARKIPIHGIGIQAHLIEDSPPNFASFYANLKRFSELGLEIHLTEVDVRIKTPVTDVKLQHQAEIYAELFRLALHFESVTNITLWGISDAYTWIPGAFPGYGNPLLFNKHFNPKQAYYSVQVALQTGPTKPTYDIENAGRHVPVAFKAAQAQNAPVPDGIASPGEWDSAIVYPFAYNRLNANDQRVPETSDLLATWRVLTLGNTIYCLITRKDDSNEVKNARAADNDGVEITFQTGEKPVTLRTVVGRDFEKSNYMENKKAVWSKNGETCEIAIDLPPPSMEGKIIGFNITVSEYDTDGSAPMKLSPLTGTSATEKSEELGELELMRRGTASERISKARIPLPFRAVRAEKAPVIDGKISGGEWDAGVSYSFAYNQLSGTDLTRPSPSNLSGDWRVVYSGNTIYGMVRRTDDITYLGAPDSWENDTIEVFFDVEGVFVQLRALAGKNFETVVYKGKKKSAWSKNGEVFEFSVELPAKELGGVVAGWNIALSDNDGKKTRDTQLYALPGTNISWKNEELGEIAFE